MKKELGCWKTIVVLIALTMIFLAVTYLMTLNNTV